jgi:ribosomal protein L12E/L44/L45/RPP1/RPP2
MKHLAAYLLLTLGGNTSPSAKDITNVLSAVGIEADDDRLEKLIDELKGKDINEVITKIAGCKQVWTPKLTIFYSWSPRVRLSSLPFPAVVLVAPLLLVVLPLVVLLLPRRRLRRRKRVRWHTVISCSVWTSLTISTEKEESDDDMGFGLFD